MRFERLLQKMDETLTIIRNTVDAGGGSVSWEAIVNAVSFQNRRYIMPAIKQLEAAGTYKREVRATETGATFAVVKVQAV